MGAQAGGSQQMTPLEPRADFGILIDRLLRLLRLDTSVFAEVRNDPAATVPAVAVVVLSSLLAAIGGWIWWQVQDFGEHLPDGSEMLVESVLLGTIFSVALWIVWLLVAWVILAQLFRADADWQQMLRTMGLASAPFAISLLMFIPGLDFGIGLISIGLMFALTAIAIQMTTTANLSQVMLANTAGFAVWALILGLLVTQESPLAPGPFLYSII
jgi:hypothetical protein